MDMLHRCYRCNEQNTLDDICHACKEELKRTYETTSWRSAWELEKQAALRREIEGNPAYVAEQLAEFDRLIAKYLRDDSEFTAAIKTARTRFMRRVETTQPD